MHSPVKQEQKSSTQREKSLEEIKSDFTSAKKKQFQLDMQLNSEKDDIKVRAQRGIEKEDKMAKLREKSREAK